MAVVVVKTVVKSAETVVDVVADAVVVVVIAQTSIDAVVDTVVDQSAAPFRTPCDPHPFQHAERFPRGDEKQSVSLLKLKHPSPFGQHRQGSDLQTTHSILSCHS